MASDISSKPLFLVSAVAHGSGAFQGQVEVDSKSNETPAARELLRAMGPLDGIMTTFDAAHTYAETAQTIVASLRRMITINGIRDHNPRNWRSRSADYAPRRGKNLRKCQLLIA